MTDEREQQLPHLVPVDAAELDDLAVEIEDGLELLERVRARLAKLRRAS